MIIIIAPKTVESHSPHGSHRSHFLPVPSCSVSTCFWLVVAYKISDQQPSKANVYYIFGIFSSIDSTVQTMGCCPPMRSPPPPHASPI